MTTTSLPSRLAAELSYDSILAIVVSRSRCQAIYREWQDKNYKPGKDLLDAELEEYARALSQLPSDVWPAGKHDQALQHAIEGWQSEVGMLQDDVSWLYGSNEPQKNDSDDGRELAGV